MIIYISRKNGFDILESTGFPKYLAERVRYNGNNIFNIFFTKFGENLYFHDFQYFPISYKYDFNLFGILHHKDNGGKPDFLKIWLEGGDKTAGPGSTNPDMLEKSVRASLKVI